MKEKIFSGCLALGLLLLCPVAAHADTTPGTIHGTFAVNPTGAATYEIPIYLPPGVKGMKPKLSLSYNSQHGPGLAGYGWTLSGLSAITRCGNTLAQDGVIQALTFTNADDYCLDGQKLQPLPSGNGFYRTEIDHFSNVRAYYTGGGVTTSAGPQWFEVQSKDGLTYIYGATADSDIIAHGLAFGPSSCTSTNIVVRVWALNEITDRYGNAISFHYAQDSSNCTGDYWPTSITYTDTASISSPGTTTDPVTATGPQKIVFSYDNLATFSPVPPDLSVAYRGGADVGSVRRLNGITVSYGGTTSFVYGLQYQQDSSTRYSELTSVTECAGAACTAATTSPSQCSGTCFPSTTVNWGAGGTRAGWQGVTASSTVAGIYAGYGVLLDAFGDGSEDFAYALNNGGYIGQWIIFGKNPNNQGLSGPMVTPNYMLGDPSMFPAAAINYFGNGQQSIVQVGASSTSISGSFHIYSFTRSGGVVTATDFDTKIGIQQYGDASQFFVADINGDGLDDIVTAPLEGLPTNGHEGLVAYLNSPSGISTTPTILFDSGGSTPYSFYHNGLLTSGVRTADFDGDGRTDILVNVGGTNTWQAFVSGGTQTAPTMSIFDSLKDVDSNYPPLLLDANGDGLTDVAYVCLVNGATTCHGGDLMLAVSSGKKFLVYDTGRGAPGSGGAPYFATDYYGTGRQGIMFAYNGDWWYFNPYYDASTGYYTFSSSFDLGISTSQLPSNTLVFSTDVDGDGLPDLFGISLSSGTLAYALHNSNPLRVASITDGLQNSLQLSYQAIDYVGSGSVYSVGSNRYTYQDAPYMGPLYVVSSAVASSGANNGDPSTYTDSYTYSGAAQDLTGRGFLGFATVQQADSRLGEKTVTDYEQSFPYIGLVKDQTVYASDGTAQHYLQNDYQNIPTVSAPWVSNNPPPVAAFPYVYVNFSDAYGSDSDDAMSGQLVKSIKTTSYFDGWGNPTSVVTQTDLGTPDVYETNVISTYSPDSSLAHWCLGLPDTVTVAKAYGSPTWTSGTNPLPRSNQSRETTYTTNKSLCRVDSQTAVAAEPGMSLTTTYLYKNAQGTVDPNGNVDEITVADDNKDVLRDTLYDYTDPLGVSNGVFPTTTTRKELVSGTSLVTGQSWDYSKGVMLSETDNNDNLTTNRTYDGFGRELSETEPDKTYTNFSYSSCPTGCQVGASYNVVQTHFSNSGDKGSWERTKYDSFGRPVQTLNFVLGDQLTYTSTEYNARGLVAAVSAPYASTAQYWTTTTYDNQNRPKKVVKPDGTGNTQTTKYGYNQDSSGSQLQYGVTQTVTVTNPGGAPASETTTKQYDSNGLVYASTDAYGTSVYNHDAFLDTYQITDNAGHKTSMVYDSVGHETQLTDPDSGVSNYVYDALGELTQQTDADGHQIDQKFDTLGRRIQRTELGTDGNPETSTWTYDSCPGGAGKLCMESRGTGFMRAYGYDAFGRPQSTDTNIGGTDYVSTTNYNAFGGVASVSYPATPAPTDTAPVANAGSNQTVVVGTVVNLTGAGSTESSTAPLPLTYTWSQMPGEPVNVGIDGARTVAVSFTPTIAGVYTFQLEVGDGFLTNTTTVTVTVQPTVPGAITFTPAGPSTTGSYTVNWGASNGGTGMTYNLYESTDGVNFALLPTSYTSASAALTGRGSTTQNLTYTYEVQACLNGVCSPLSATAGIQVILPPGAPGALNISPSPSTDGNFTVTWAPSTSGVVTGYQLYQSTDQSTWTTIPVSGTSWSATGMAFNNYYYKVAACNGTVCSSTAVVNEQVVPPAPTGLYWNPAPSVGTSTLYWNSVPGAIAYQAYWSTDGGVTYKLYDTGTPTSNTLWFNTAGTVYAEVAACAALSGTTASLCGPVSAPASVVINPVPTPAAPTTTPNPSGTGNFTVKWTAPMVGITSYTLFISTDNSTWSFAGGLAGSNLQTTQMSLSEPTNGTYYFQVSACVNSQCSRSPSGSVQVLLTPGVPAASVSGVTSTTVAANTSYTISWTKPSGIITSYVIQQDENDPNFGGPTGWRTGSNSKSFSQSATGTYWYYRVQACDSSSCSAWSNTVTVHIATGGGGGGGGAGGCPPPPQVCQFVLPDDYASVDVTGMKLDSASVRSVVPTALPVAVAKGVTTGHSFTDYNDQSLVAQQANARQSTLRDRLLQQPRSIILPSAQAAWQQRWAGLKGGSATPMGQPSTLGASFDGSAQGVNAPATAQESFEEASEAGVYRTTDFGNESLQARLSDQGQPSSNGADYRVQDSTSTTSNYTVDYVYDDHEVLEAVVDDQDPTLVYWQAEAMDSQGHVTGEIFGNNVLTTSAYDPVRGNVLGVQSGVTGTEIQNLEYHWDGYGNLYTRQMTGVGTNPSPTETFQYDDINRVTQATVSGSSVTVAPLQVAYEPIGVIDSKSDVGAYTYNPACAHCLDTVTSAATNVVTSYSYDPAGNLKSSTDGRTVQYTSENQPWTISSSGGTDTFSYDPEGQRYMEYDVSGGAGTTELEVGGNMEVVTPDGGTPTYRLMITAGGKIVAVRTVHSDGTFTVDYMHYDHLGSVDAISDASGNLTQAMSFDAFGNRRDPITWAPLSTAANQTAITDHGYTDQQMLDNLGLIHMEGRVYDPVLGRFMSADPNIPDPYNSQSLDRYAYASNNPLNRTDPTGFDDTNGNGNADAPPAGSPSINLFSLAASIFDSSLVASGLAGNSTMTADTSTSLGAPSLTSDSNPSGFDYSTNMAGNPQINTGLLTGMLTLNWPNASNNGIANSSDASEFQFNRSDLLYYLTGVGLTEPSFGSSFDIRDVEASEYIPIHRAEYIFADPYTWSLDPVNNITAKHQFAGINNDDNQNWYEYTHLDEMDKPTYQALQISKNVAIGIVNGTESDPCPSCLWMWTNGVTLPDFLRNGLNDGTLFEADFGGNRYFGPAMPMPIPQPEPVIQQTLPLLNLPEQ